MQTPCVCFHVRKLSRLITQVYDNHLRIANITSSQYGLLRCIEALHEPFISDIGRILAMSQTTVTRNIKKLDEMGLILTRQAAADPRKKLVSLSSAGKLKLVEAHPLWEQAQESLATHMGRERMEELLHLARETAGEWQ